MSVTIDTSGFDKLKTRAEETRRKGAAGVPLKELFHDNFMAEHTEFRSIDEMIKASGIDIESFKNPDGFFDEFIRSHTQFPSWKEMLGTATKQWVLHGLGFNKK